MLPSRECRNMLIIMQSWIYVCSWRTRQIRTGCRTFFSLSPTVSNITVEYISWVVFVRRVKSILVSFPVSDSLHDGFRMFTWVVVNMILSCATVWHASAVGQFCPCGLTDNTASRQLIKCQTNLWLWLRSLLPFCDWLNVRHVVRKRY